MIKWVRTRRLPLKKFLSARVWGKGKGHLHNAEGLLEARDRVVLELHNLHNNWIHNLTTIRFTTSQNNNSVHNLAK